MENWNRTSEVTLANKEGKHDLKFFGRGMEPRMVPNTVSAPRDSEGFAVSAEIGRLQVFVNWSTRAAWLRDKELTGTREFRTLTDRLSQARAEDPVLDAPLDSIIQRMAELKNQLRQERTQGWKKWVRDAGEKT